VALIAERYAARAQGGGGARLTSVSA